MKNKRQFILGFLFAAVLFGSVTAFAETSAKIEVIFDKVKLVVNGKMTNTSTMLYDGRTYIQLRGASEAFAAELDWDSETNTASLTTNQVDIAPIATEQTRYPSPSPTPVPTQKSEPSSTPSPTPKPEVPVSIDMFGYTVTTRYDERFDRSYIETEVKNYSEYAMSNFRLTYLRREYMVKYTLSTSGYVIMPGKSSPMVETRIPNGCSMSELELIETDVTLRRPNGDEFSIYYDHQTKTYRTIGNW